VTDWRAFDAALERFDGAFWWRDDDAISDTASLRQLMELADNVEAPLTLAVIPAHLDDTLPKLVSGRIVTVAVHGWSHSNHAPEGEKKAEFRAHRPEQLLLEEASQGKKLLDDAFGKQSVPVFIPPWNRMDEDLPLSELGYCGLSIYGKRELTLQGDLVRFDSHIDPIDWRGTRSAVDLQTIINELTALMSSNAPIGLMTHHLVHDQAIWGLMDVLVKRLKAARAAWTSAGDLVTRAVE